MASKVIVLSTAKEDLARLPKSTQERISGAIDDLADFPERRTGVKKLKPPFDGYRKRVGTQRILFDYENKTVFIHGIKDRKDAYR